MNNAPAMDCLTIIDDPTYDQPHDPTPVRDVPVTHLQMSSTLEMN